MNPLFSASRGGIARILQIMLLTFGAGAALGGCSTFENIEGPPPAFDIDNDIKQLEAQYGSATSIQAYYAAGPETVERRNAFITGRITLINLKYLKYIQQLPVTTSSLNSAVDIAKLGVDLATVQVGGTTAKSILGAVSAGLSGTRLSIENNFFDQKTAQTLVIAMNAQRKASLISIIAGTKSDITTYPLAQAIVDLNSYYYAGTLNGALEAVQADAGAKDAASQKTIDQYRSVAFAADSATQRITTWLYPGATIAANGAAVNASGNPMAPNTANAAALRAWLNTNGFDGLPIATFLNSSALAQARLQAAAALNIP